MTDAHSNASRKSRSNDADGSVKHLPIIRGTGPNSEESETDLEENIEKSSLLKRSRSSKRKFKSSLKSKRTRSDSDSDSLSDDSSDVIDSVNQSCWNYTREQKVVLWTTSLCDFLAYLSVSLMAPFFPEEALKKDVSDTMSGWIFGSAALTQCIISPVFGKLMPYFGVKNMFFAGMLLFGSCTLLFGFLSFITTTHGNGTFIAIAFILQVLKSMGVACSATASFVLTIQQFPDNIATMFGLGEIFVGFGLILGPGIGGILYGIGGFCLPFVSVGSLALSSVPCMIWAMSSIKSVDERTGNKNLPVHNILCSPQGLIISASIIIGTAMWSILDPTLEPHLRQFNLSPEMVGVVFLIMAVVYSISAPLWGWMADKMDDQRIFLSMGFVAASVGSLLIGPSPLLSFSDGLSELWLVVISLVILGASASLCTIPTFDMYFTLAEDLGYEDDTRTYSMVSGLWMAMYSFGDFIGPSIGGALTDSIGFNNMCTYVAAICILMAVVLIQGRLRTSCRNCCRDSMQTIQKRSPEEKARIFSHYVTL